MRFDRAIDEFLADMRSQGRINSTRTEVSYRARLLSHAEDVGNRDPRKTGRDDVKRTLRRWSNPNTQRNAHAILTSFYNWCEEEGLRETNPARQVRKARRRPTSVYRPTREECVRLLDVSSLIRRERWAVTLMLAAGLRNAEMRGLQARHLARPGWIWVSEDIAKGRRERYVPVIEDAADVVAEILEALTTEQYVLGRTTWADPPRNQIQREDHSRPSSAQALWRMVGEIGQRAGIAAPIGPHSLRHGFGTHVARVAGLRAAQEVLGHVSVDTTAGSYVDRPTLDELAARLAGVSYRGLSPRQLPDSPDKATTGIEPVTRSSGSVAAFLEPSVRDLAARVRLYEEALASA